MAVLRIGLSLIRQSIHNLPQNYLKHRIAYRIIDNYLKLWQNLTRPIRKTYAQDIPKTRQRYAKDMPMIWSRYANDMPKICQKYAPVMPHTSPTSHTTTLMSRTMFQLFKCLVLAGEVGWFRASGVDTSCNFLPVMNVQVLMSAHNPPKVTLHGNCHSSATQVPEVPS